MSQQAISRSDTDTGRHSVGGGSGQQGEDRMRVLHLLDERVRFESLLSRLSATFINLPAEEVDTQIERGLQQIVDFLGIERSSLAQFSEDGGDLLVTHS